MARLGTETRPAFCRVRSREKLEEVKKLCLKQGWHLLYSVDSSQPENISDIKTLIKFAWCEGDWMNKKVGRNDSCPCGSGKKYKKCCLNF